MIFDIHYSIDSSTIHIFINKFQINRILAKYIRFRHSQFFKIISNSFDKAKQIKRFTSYVSDLALKCKLISKNAQRSRNSFTFSTIILKHKSAYKDKEFRFEGEHP